ncbi:cysteine desulfurase-like protein [Thiotrichales bacterium 19S11-10]|nr:cysteine desulfurase-like protein [Thiotrichales bacterium 19S11-10]MCF6808131.1 cysteine desulfurase-like protein [Thiotrichales bacterium 19S9-11]MCF6812147.1 cysteine desulfurase-like protein [Thiotrichales bacterium 19S9-12]
MFNIANIRNQFPALHQNENGIPATFFDAPAGSQIPEVVINRLDRYYKSGVASYGGFYKASLQTEIQVQNTRKAVQILLNARSKDEISFGQNMTSLTFSFSRSLANTWTAGDELIVTDLDHEANIYPWEIAAKEKNVEVKTWHFNSESCNLDIEDLANLLTPKTKLLALTAASNICGSLPNLKAIIELAHQNNTLVFVDATQLAFHEIIDVQDLDCDFLVCSAYKFCGPHIGILYGKRFYMENLVPYKIPTIDNSVPYCWEMGTQNFSAISALEETVRYLASFSDVSNFSRYQFTESMAELKHYELMLKQYFLSKLESLEMVKVYGVDKPEDAENRTPTFALSINGYCAVEITRTLVENGFYVACGHFNAPKFIERFDLASGGGVVRIGFAHYNTLEEIEFLISTLEEICIPVGQHQQIVNS